MLDSCLLDELLLLLFLVFCCIDPNAFWWISLVDEYSSLAIPFHNSIKEEYTPRPIQTKRYTNKNTLKSKQFSSVRFRLFWHLNSFYSIKIVFFSLLLFCCCLLFDNCCILTLYIVSLLFHINNRYVCWLFVHFSFITSNLRLFLITSHLERISIDIFEPFSLSSSPPDFSNQNSNGNKAILEEKYSKTPNKFVILQLERLFIHSLCLSLTLSRSLCLSPYFCSFTSSSESIEFVFVWSGFTDICCCCCCIAKAKWITARAHTYSIYHNLYTPEKYDTQLATKVVLWCGLLLVEFSCSWNNSFLHPIYVYIIYVISRVYMRPYAWKSSFARDRIFFICFFRATRKRQNSMKEKNRSINRCFSFCSSDIFSLFLMASNSRISQILWPRLRTALFCFHKKIDRFTIDCCMYSGQ